MKGVVLGVPGGNVKAKLEDPRKTGRMECGVPMNDQGALFTPEKGYSIRKYGLLG